MTLVIILLFALFVWHLIGAVGQRKRLSRSGQSKWNKEHDGAFSYFLCPEGSTCIHLRSKIYDYASCHTRSTWMGGQIFLKNNFAPAPEVYISQLVGEGEITQHGARAYFQLLRIPPKRKRKKRVSSDWARFSSFFFFFVVSLYS